MQFGREVTFFALLVGGTPASGAEPTVLPTLELPRGTEFGLSEPPSKPVPMMLELGFFGGAFFPAGDHELYDSTQSLHSSFQDVGPKIGLRAAFFPLAVLGLEAEGGYSPLINGRDELNHLYDLRGHAVVQIPWRVAPYLAAGGGFVGIGGERGGDIDGLLHWGAGVRVFATPWVQVRFDGRHIISGARGPGAGNTDHFEVSAGLSFVLFREDDEKTPFAQIDPLLLEPSRTPPASEPKVVKVVATRVLYFKDMDPVHFGFDSAAVPAGFEPVLREIIDMLVERPELELVVVGHADSTGPEHYNQDLSERRAEAVVVFVVEGGVERSRIEFRGKGERDPVASNDTERGRQLNRRTELTVLERPSEADQEGPEVATRPDPSGESKDPQKTGRTSIRSPKTQPR